MRKFLLATLGIGLIATFAYAGPYIKLVYSDSDLPGKVVKFEDGTVTCYVISTGSTFYQAGVKTSISCLQIKK